jgi:hypothetical protein
MAMSAPKEEMIRAINSALAGRWDAAHELVQQYEDDATASWIHAVLHKLEGDLANSRHWYRRAGRLDHAADEPRAELAAIQAGLGSRGANLDIQSNKRGSDWLKNKSRIQP